MRVRFLKQGKLFIVERINSKQIVFSNKSKVNVMSIYLKQ